ncbi:DUF916 and DUF3324 domain-containing protein [Enterococcus faecalis]|jgi:hypothetical protein|uniref:DUF916 and DUF3324 domain-containing protein n=1 Tax=Enterococcus faecalis TaxID=1351 RepID=UPI002986C922|nr:DUF916 and DUF3324 domain-containing protein [Enterococcus faecalis]EKB7628475.1 DUF916 and DUF3324 domain-containing protein [Enterococcus faecalis]
MKSKIVCFLGILFFVGIGLQQRVQAQTTSSVTQANSYSVSPGFGTTQKKETTSFYDMRLQPNQTDTFQVTITNQAKQPQAFQVMVNTATTNRNGIVDYTKTDFSKDPSMTLAIKDLITIDQPKVTIPANHSQTVTFHVTMPDQPLTGILLGGVVVRPVQEKKQGTGIQNVFMHTLAIRVDQTDAPVPTKLIGGDVTIGQDNLHNQVSMALRNPEPKLLTQLDGTFTVTKKGQSKALAKKTSKNLSIAPNSAFSLPVALDQNFKAGDYTYTIQLKNANGEWKFSKDFTIKRSEAKKYNQTSVDQAKSPWKQWALYGGLVFLVLILCGLFYYLGKKKKK